MVHHYDRAHYFGIWLAGLKRARRASLLAMGKFALKAVTGRLQRSSFRMAKESRIRFSSTIGSLDHFVTLYLLPIVRVASSQ